MCVFFGIILVSVWVWIAYEVRRAPLMDNDGNVIFKKPKK